MHRISMVDAFSKWPQVCVMQSTTVTKTIEALRQMKQGLRASLSSGLPLPQ